MRCLVPQAYDLAGLTGALAQVWMCCCVFKLRAAAPAVRKGADVALTSQPSAPATTLPTTLGQQSPKSPASFALLRLRGGISITVKNLTDQAIALEVESSCAMDTGMARTKTLAMKASPLASNCSPFPTSGWRRPLVSRLPTLPLLMSPLQASLPACSLPKPQPPPASRQPQPSASKVIPTCALSPW